MNCPENNYSLIDSIPEKIKNYEKVLEADQAYWVGDLNKVKNALDKWDNYLPNVHMHYAIKCCNEPNLVQFIIQQGKGFDCASLNEIKQVLNQGCDPSKILFAHPLKTSQSITFAKENGVKKLVVDCEEELIKISKIYPDAEIFIRVKISFTRAEFNLSEKFGAEYETALCLIKRCKQLNMKLIGFSFHVGSKCDDRETFDEAIKYVNELKKKAEEKSFKITFIDIGGGFNPLSKQTKFSFKTVAKTIKDAIETYINDEEVQFYAEPGRFIANDYLDLYLPIVCSKAKVDQEKKSQLIYVPDGIYGAFNAIVYDHAKPHFLIHQKGNDKQIYDTKIYGQTCDSMDVVYSGCKWPRLQVGDSLYIENFGAYTYSPSSFFNGFGHHQILMINPTL